MIKLILAVDNSGGIGKNGDLAWNIKQDLKYFKEKTTQGNKINIVLMGRKTYDSIPEKYRPLKDRMNFVITSKEKSDYLDFKNMNGPYFFRNIELGIFNSRLLCSKSIVNDVYIIGGASIYDYFLKNNLDIIDEILLTKVEGDFNCDVKVDGIFEILEKHFEEKESSGIKEEINENTGEKISFIFKRYEKKNFT